jgi:hypothetical protein
MTPSSGGEPGLGRTPTQGGGGSCAMSAHSRFVLNRHGKVFHLPGCYMAGNAQPWAWVEPLTNSQILRWIKPLGIRPCRRCDPLDADRS